METIWKVRLVCFNFTRLILYVAFIISEILLVVMRAGAELHTYMKDNNVNPIKSLLFPMIQVSEKGQPRYFAYARVILIILCRNYFRLQFSYHFSWR